MCSPNPMTVEEFRARFNEIVETAESSAIFVRARELQEESLQVLTTLLDECRANKATAIQQVNDDAANAYLAFECMAEALSSELRFNIALKADEVDQAWDHLMDAQSSAISAVKAHKVADHLKHYIEKLYLLESVLFPKPAFFSSGWIVRESECSICGLEYGICDHIKGRPYMGQLCARVITDGIPQEVSIVAVPADKHCRVLHFSKDEKWINAFTHREAPEGTVGDCNPGPREAMGIIGRTFLTPFWTVFANEEVNGPFS